MIWFLCFFFIVWLFPVLLLVPCPVVFQSWHPVLIHVLLTRLQIIPHFLCISIDNQTDLILNWWRTSVFPFHLVKSDVRPNSESRKERILITWRVDTSVCVSHEDHCPWTGRFLVSKKMHAKATVFTIISLDSWRGFPKKLLRIWTLSTESQRVPSVTITWVNRILPVSCVS